MSAGPPASVRLPLPAPYEVGWARWYLAAHTVPGLESVAVVDSDGRYVRTLTLALGPALLSLRVADAAVEVELVHGSPADLGEAVGVVRRLLDLDVDAAAADAHLARDPALAPSVAAAPGLRVPGAVDGWELLVRTMVGQQISLAAARTHLGRLVGALGASVGAWSGHEGGGGGEWRLFPTPAAVATAGHEVLGGPRRRVAAVVAAARLVADGGLDLAPGREPAALRAELLALPGVGPWTADYVVMRLAQQPDILLAGDLVVQQGARLLGLTPHDLADPDRWSPYRSYATMHLWRVALAERAARSG